MLGCGRFVIKSMGVSGSKLSTKIAHSVEVLFSFWQVPPVQPMLHKGSSSMRGCDSEDRRRCIYATAHITYWLAVGFLFSS
jgi:hypothetical protein